MPYVHTLLTQDSHHQEQKAHGGLPKEIFRLWVGTTAVCARASALYTRDRAAGNDYTSFTAAPGFHGSGVLVTAVGSIDPILQLSIANILKRDVTKHPSRSTLTKITMTNAFHVGTTAIMDY